MEREVKKKILAGLATGLLIAGAAGSANADLFGGVDNPGGISSFADYWVDYNHQSPPNPELGEDEFRDPTNALGAPDFIQNVNYLAYMQGPPSDYDKDPGNYVSLGWGGVLVVEFTDNYLTTSEGTVAGTDAHDLWIFEIGQDIEPTIVEISTDGNTWINVGSTSGGTGGIDIDPWVPSGSLYSSVRITDPNNPGYICAAWGGADIDAVGAISSIPANNPVPEPATMLLFGTGLAGIAGSRFRKKKK